MPPGKGSKKERQHIRFLEIDEAQRLVELVSQQPDDRIPRLLAEKDRSVFHLS